MSREPKHNYFTKTANRGVSTFFHATIPVLFFSLLKAQACPYKFICTSRNYKPREQDNQKKKSCTKSSINEVTQIKLGDSSRDARPGDISTENSCGSRIEMALICTICTPWLSDFGSDLQIYTTALSFLSSWAPRRVHLFLLGNRHSTFGGPSVTRVPRAEGDRLTTRRSHIFTYIYIYLKLKSYHYLRHTFPVKSRWMPRSCTIFIFLENSTSGGVGCILAMQEDNVTRVKRSQVEKEKPLDHRRCSTRTHAPPSTTSTIDNRLFTAQTDSYVCRSDFRKNQMFSTRWFCNFK